MTGNHHASELPQHSPKWSQLTNKEPLLALDMAHTLQENGKKLSIYAGRLLVWAGFNLGGLTHKASMPGDGSANELHEPLHSHLLTHTLDTGDKCYLTKYCQVYSTFFTLCSLIAYDCSCRWKCKPNKKQMGMNIVHHINKINT